MNIYYINFGCKVNAYELEAIKELAESLGHSEVSDVSLADAVIINSCTVTGEASRKCKNAAKSARLHNKNACVAIIGCFPQAFKQSLLSQGYFDVAVGTKNKASVINYIEQFLKTRKRIIAVDEFAPSDTFEQMRVCRSDSKTRAVLKIEDGCNMFCSYCIIPFARGRVRSRSLEEIKSEAIKLADHGHKEIVLVGINLCCYGKDLQNTTLADAVRVVNDIPQIERIRLGSIEPEMLDDNEIAKLKGCEKLCGHFHLSLQSGCDKTLKAMNRRYTTKQYKTLVKKLRAEFENASITTDIMVGFPGETDEDFNQSLEFVKDISFASAHIFPYSVREGTKAAGMPGQVSPEIKKQRTAKMKEITDACKNEFLRSQVSKLQRVIFERDEGLDYHRGHTENYTPVRVPKIDIQSNLHKKSFCVRIVEARDDFCLGEIEDDKY
ncbi:MAG: tRNA (N(6)-L-threonylcarbamoyladenosine(37)-C(2))-methylthiotransferase MtaB [Ruminococcus sp.]|nr:tRNA (N(6)-L-threonylcarbamoyladenosine(37)-C(2))-methylthiotransferase MtaB [Ruminococcus sp.]